MQSVPVEFATVRSFPIFYYGYLTIVIGISFKLIRTYLSQRFNLVIVKVNLMVNYVELGMNVKTTTAKRGAALVGLYNGL